MATACGEAEARLCRPSVPVTESNPCSKTVTREYSRSRSPLSVSMAEASRRASFWLSLATDWICCDCRARSVAATWSRRTPIEDWLASSATTTALIAETPHEPSRHSEKGSNSSSSAKNPASKPPVLSVSKPARWLGFFAMRRFRPPIGPSESPRTLTGKFAVSLDPGGVFPATNQVSTAAENAL